MKRSKDIAALWQCENCHAWWCSQPTVQPTEFMLSLPLPLLEAMGWENFRGWQVGGTPHVSTCPDCGAVQQAPVRGEATAMPRPRASLSDLLRPALAR
jgi:hypothetical protein